VLLLKQNTPVLSLTENFEENQSLSEKLVESIHNFQIRRESFIAENE